MIASGPGSEDGCEGYQASAEPDEGGQSQRGSLPLVEEEDESWDGIRVGIRGLGTCAFFLLH